MLLEGELIFRGSQEYDVLLNLMEFGWRIDMVATAYDCGG